jgi:hypothetical protein
MTVVVFVVLVVVVALLDAIVVLSVKVVTVEVEISCSSGRSICIRFYKHRCCGTHRRSWRRGLIVVIRMNSLPRRINHCRSSGNRSHMYRGGRESCCCRSRRRSHGIL